MSTPRHRLLMQTSSQSTYDDTNQITQPYLRNSRSNGASRCPRPLARLALHLSTSHRSLAPLEACTGTRTAQQGPWTTRYLLTALPLVLSYPDAPLLVCKGSLHSTLYARTMATAHKPSDLDAIVSPAQQTVLTHSAAQGASLPLFSGRPHVPSVLLPQASKSPPSSHQPT